MQIAVSLGNNLMRFLKSLRVQPSGRALAQHAPDSGIRPALQGRKRRGTAGTLNGRSRGPQEAPRLLSLSWLPLLSPEALNPFTPQACALLLLRILLLHPEFEILIDNCSSV